MMRMIDADHLAERICKKLGSISDSAEATAILRIVQQMIHSEPNVELWRSHDQGNPDGGKPYYMLYFSIKGNKAMGDDNDLIDCAYQDSDGNWFYPSDVPVITDNEELEIKHWMPVPELPKPEKYLRHE